MLDGDITIATTPFVVPNVERRARLRRWLRCDGGWVDLNSSRAALLNFLHLFELLLRMCRCERGLGRCGVGWELFGGAFARYGAALRQDLNFGHCRNGKGSP